MKGFNGGSINNVIRYMALNEKSIYVTDTAEKAIRYANAQATGVVKAKRNQAQAEGTVVLEIEAPQIKWQRREEDHQTLDLCEAYINNWQIVKAIIRFCAYQNTSYGTRHSGYMSANEVVEMLKAAGIEVEVI